MEPLMEVVFRLLEGEPLNNARSAAYVEVVSQADYLSSRLT